MSAQASNIIGLFEAGREKLHKDIQSAYPESARPSM